MIDFGSNFKSKPSQGQVNIKVKKSRLADSHDGHASVKISWGREEWRKEVMAAEHHVIYMHTLALQR